MPDTVDQLMKEMADAKAFIETKTDAKIKPVSDEIKRVAESVTTVQTQLKEFQTREASRIMHGSDLVVRNGRYAGADISDLSASISMLNLLAQKRSYSPFSDDRRAVPFREAIEARNGLKAAITPDYINAWEEHAMKLIPQNTSALARMRFRESVRAWAWDLRNEYKKSKALDSTTAAAGDELVPTLENANLWLDVNIATVVLPALTQAPMPSTPYDWPTQLGDANWYPTQENVHVTTTTPTTAKAVLTAYGLKTGVPFSDELNEDAVINLVAELRAGLARNAAQIIDDVLLNADNTVTNGINSDGATISASDAGKAHWLLGWTGGLIHLPLITAAAALRNDRNGAVTAADVYNKAMRMIGKYAFGAQGDAFFISDVNTWIASLTIAEVETLDTFGPRATISSGELARVYGLPLIVSDRMRLADTDGKVTDAGNGTSTGRVFCTNGTQWRVGFRRGITFEADREPGKGQTTLYVSMRLALMDRTNYASTATHSSIVYDITGVT
jgi:HK97 family phage major capsid protein